MSDGEWTGDVRFRGIRRYKGARGITYTVRWTVRGKDIQQTFASAKLAEGFRSSLVVAARQGEKFSRRNGLPQSMSPASVTISWLEHAIEFIAMKWPDAAPKYRKSLAGSLTLITMPMLQGAPTTRPSDSDLREALYGWAFNGVAQRRPPPDEVAKAVEWMQGHSRPVEDLSDPDVLRAVLDAISRNLDGTRAAKSTMARRHSALHNCLDYAVERGRLRTNPLTGIRRKRQPPPAGVDRRRVVNPTQARALLAAVEADSPELEAFFAVLYYAGLRPAEALNLRRRDCTLPEQGWGQLLLSGSYQRGGASWTDSGSVHEERQLKHRDRADTREVPAHPELVAILRRHMATFQLGQNGRLFVARTGRAGRPLPTPFQQPVSMNTVYRAWARARRSALTSEEFESLLAGRPYDLRHACLSTWLNAGVPAVQVAAWAGHSVAVLLNVYAKCLDGAEETARRRIETAMTDPQPGPQPGLSTKTSPAIPPRQPKNADPGRKQPDSEKGP